MSAKPVVEEFTRLRIGEAEGDEAGDLSIFCTLTTSPILLDKEPLKSFNRFNINQAIDNDQLAAASHKDVIRM